MKNIFFVLFVVAVFFSCEKPSDCIKSTGAMTTKTVELPTFYKIFVKEGIGLVISQGDTQKIEIKSGQNLINDIEAKVVDGVLYLEDKTTCNWVRDYGQTVVYITAPNIAEIYSKTSQNIVSDGVLKFEKLTISAIDNFDGLNGSGTGDYVLQIENKKLVIETNNVARFTITGKTDDFQVNVYEGNGIVDTPDFLAKNVTVYHRGSNRVTVNPIESITGDIYNIGNVYCKSQPLINTVKQHYKGRVIFL